MSLIGPPSCVALRRCGQEIRGKKGSLRHRSGRRTMQAPRRVSRTCGLGCAGVGDPGVGALGQAPAKPVLVVGYGSSLRGDDAIGQRVVEELRRRRGRVIGLAGAKFVLAPCLTPELAEDIASAGFAIFADAASDGRPVGAVSVETVLAGTDRGPGGLAAGRAAAGCWEDLSPRGLLRLASELYGSVPPAVLVSVGVGRTSLGEGLSAPVAAAVATAALAAEKALGSWASVGRVETYPRGSLGGTSTML